MCEVRIIYVFNLEMVIVDSIEELITLPGFIWNILEKQLAIDVKSWCVNLLI